MSSAACVGVLLRASGTRHPQLEPNCEVEEDVQVRRCKQRKLHAVDHKRWCLM